MKIFNLILCICLFCTSAVLAGKDGSTRTLNGLVEGNGVGQSGYKVSLYVTEAGSSSGGRVIGTTMSRNNGTFEIEYFNPHIFFFGKHLIYYVLAENGPAMLASAISTGRGIPNDVVVNERTTVAMGTAFAQFIQGRKLVGNTYGMTNAVNMAANMANPATGELGAIISNLPNGNDTTTLKTFNSLTNVVASCIAEEANCYTLFSATTPTGGQIPKTVLQAVANIPQYPWYPGFPNNNLDPLFVLSELNPINQPARTDRPTSWLLFIKFTGGFYSEQDANNLINGPGNIALDRRGVAWINDNFVPQSETSFACAGLRLLKFYPWGETFPGSPFPRRRTQRSGIRDYPRSSR